MALCAASSQPTMRAPTTRVLTDSGLARLQRATPLHHNCVRHYLLDQLHGVDLRALGAALERIAAAEDSTSAPGV